MRITAPVIISISAIIILILSALINSKRLTLVENRQKTNVAIKSFQMQYDKYLAYEAARALIAEQSTTLDYPSFSTKLVGIEVAEPTVEITSAEEPVDGHIAHNITYTWQSISKRQALYSLARFGKEDCKRYRITNFDLSIPSEQANLTITLTTATQEGSR